MNHSVYTIDLAPFNFHLYWKLHSQNVTSKQNNVERNGLYGNHLHRRPTSFTRAVSSNWLQAIANDTMLVATMSKNSASSWYHGNNKVSVWKKKWNLVSECPLCNSKCKIIHTKNNILYIYFFYIFKKMLFEKYQYEI